MTSAPPLRRLLAWVLIPALVLLVAALTAPRWSSPAPAAGLRPMVYFHRVHGSTARPTPPTTADCLASAGIPCYSPNQYEVAYNTVGEYAKGITGAGETIAV